VIVEPLGHVGSGLPALDRCVRGPLRTAAPNVEAGVFVCPGPRLKGRAKAGPTSKALAAK
jgi:hypothetical protein